MRSFNILDLSGGLQSATSHLLRKRQEVYDSKNAVYNKIIGSAVRRDGYEQVGQTIQYGNESLFGGVYLYGSNNKIIVGVNDVSNANSTLQYLDSDNYWKTILTNSVPNTRFHAISYLNEFYVAGKAGNSQYQTLTNIDYTLVPSTTRNVANAPACRFIAQYNGSLYAMDCQVGGVTYRDRIYKSSQPTGAVTFVQTDQSGLSYSLKVNSVRYLKPGMSIDIYGAGTSQQKVQGLAITSVDKSNNKVLFPPQILPNLNNNDEIWISGRYGLLTILWNTDYPTPQSADWFALPSGEGEFPAVTGWSVNNNRFLIFSKNSTLKWDGQNLIDLSATVGCVSYESIANIGPWTFWLHDTGVWGYNDNTGQLKFISQAVMPLIRRINPGNLSKSSAVAAGRVYKLAIGQLLDPTLATTSTSTSSTSTSSTSSSTSSTSTSSTSTSSTTGTTTSTSSTSSSTSSTSTSSTSHSTSSTSTSSTSSSSSTSTSSTTTTTALTGKTVVRLCYDYNLNIWWVEEHNREFRNQFIHSMNGFTKPYFTDENGYLFRDETGYTDFGSSIPFQIETGRTNCGTEQGKVWDSVQIDSENARGALVQYALDGSDEWRTFPGVQLTQDIQTIAFPQAGEIISSRDINFRIVHDDPGAPPAINGLTIYYNLSESLVGEIGEYGGRV